MASSLINKKLYYKREMRGKIKAAISYQQSAVSYQLSAFSENRVVGLAEKRRSGEKSSIKVFRHSGFLARTSSIFSG
jgi:hypothetical protein